MLSWLASWLLRSWCLCLGRYWWPPLLGPASAELCGRLQAALALSCHAQLPCAKQAGPETGAQLPRW